MKIEFRHLLIVIMLVSCSSSVGDTFNSQQLVSSRGEKIYINSLNWGMTDDNQMSIVTSDSDRLKERTDTLGTVFGLEPFIYSFEKDTLRLIFENRITYTVQETFETITVTYKALASSDFANIRTRAYNNDGFYTVPRRKEKNYPSNRPKPPAQ